MTIVRALSLAAVLVLIACSDGADDGHGVGAGRLGDRNPIVDENDLPGDPDWRSGTPAKGELEAYADRASVRAGGVVGVKASASPAAFVDWALYRMGWYGGAGARLVAEGSGVSVAPQPRCPVQPGTGLVACAWPVSVALQVPTDAVTGLYLVKLSRADGVYTFVPLVVTDDRAPRLLFQASVTTWQAYNAWGGTSLYVDRTGSSPFGRAVKASFDRPYDSDTGSGQMLRYEVHFARFLERFGYDVGYTTNVLVSRGALDRLGRDQAFLSVGHDEYWTLEERDAIEAARDRGVSTLFFGANTGYWKIRFDDEVEPGNPRTQISYKADAAQDPVKGPDRTGLWRGAIGRPENALVGVMYESWLRISGQWIVSDASHFLYEGTGLADGDAIPALVGYEYDRTFDNGAQPAGLEVVSRSPVLDVYGVPGFSEAASYRAPSGSLVFSAASIEWSYGLGQPGVADPRVERMTANVIREATGLEVPDGVGSGAPPAPPAREGRPASAVHTLSRGLGSPTGVAQTEDGLLVVADPRRHLILAVRPDGTSYPLAGDGVASSDPAHDGVPAGRARFFGPTAVASSGAAAARVVYVADTRNHCIRTISGSSVVKVGTAAGAMGEPGRSDGGRAQARFNSPMGLAIDPASGDLLVADAGNGLVRRFDPKTGTTTILAGGGTSPADGPASATAFSYPTAVAAAPDGTVYVVDTGYGTVRRISPDGEVTTLVKGPPGAGDGTGEVARLSPQGGAAWAAGALWIAEPTRGTLRRIVPGAEAASTLVETVAGDGVAGARFGLPVGLAVARDGSVLVVDAAGGELRAVVP
ncbi:MAG TPA: N,N-dimethylformamidase beta subunit family domain-containing protein [Vulgatibacter sp.]|nr:N,N-dimethylformamidase beta subunit family domain-containing protein [Vulgatibacter sp.]